METQPRALVFFLGFCRKKQTFMYRFKHLLQPLFHHSRQKRKHFFLQPTYSSSSRSSFPLFSQIISPLSRRRHLGMSLLALFLGRSRSESNFLISGGPPKNCSRRCFTSTRKSMVLLIILLNKFSVLLATLGSLVLLQDTLMVFAQYCLFLKFSDSGL